MRRILLGGLAALALGGPLLAEPLFQTRYLGFTDVNGDGRLSCGETVTIGVFYQTDSPAGGAVDPTELHGFATFPETDSIGLDFLPGTVRTDQTFTTGCFADVLEGNTHGDVRARVEVTCAQDPVSLPGGATLALQYQARYINPTQPVFTDTATFRFDQRPPGSGDQIHSVDRQSRVATSICASPPPIVSIRKSVQGTADPGSRLVYSLTITNTSASPLGGFYAKDVVPANTTFDPVNSSPGWFCPNGGAAGAACSYLFSALPVGASTRTFAVLVDSPIPPNVSNLSNTACVAESQTVYGCDSVSIPVGGSPRLAVAKTITGGTPAGPGDVVSFEVEVQNNGNRGSSDVIVTDTLPAGTTYVASGSGAWTCSGRTCTADLGTLAAGQTRRIPIVLKMPNPLPAGVNRFTNTACASSIEGGEPVCGSATLDVSGAPVLNLKKALSQGDGTPGAPLAFTLLVRNDGNQDAAGVVVTETLSAHTTPDLARSEAGWTCSPPTCSFNIGLLPAGAQRSLSFVVNLDKPLPAGVSRITNTACASAPQVTQACDTIDVNTRGHVNLETRKTIAPPVVGQATLGKVFTGDIVVYTVTVTNSGDQDAGDVVLHETVPEYTRFEPSGSDVAWSCQNGGAAGAACSLPLGPLAAGGSASRTFVVRVGELPEGVYTVRNVACSTDVGGATGCGEIETPPNASTSLGAELTARLADDRDHSGDITPGDVLEYTAVIRNLGDTPAEAVVFTVNAPDSTTLVAGSVVPSVGSVVTGNAPSDNSVRVKLGDLAGHGTATVVYRVAIPSPLDPKVIQIVSQGSALSGNAVSTRTDDPATPAVQDPTITPVRHPQGPRIANVPTLGQSGLLVLAMGLGWAAIGLLRRKPSGPAEP